MISPIIFLLPLLLFPGAISAAKPYGIQVSDDQFPPSGVIRLTCSAKGDPQPEIHWFSYKTSSKTEAEWHTNVQGQLIIPDPQSGVIYKFYCNATNTHGSVISRTVLAGHAILGVNFESNPTDKTVREDDIIVLHCKAPRGTPTPRLYWVQYPLDSPSTNVNDGRIIGRKAKGVKFQLTKSGNLRIYDIQLSDAGIYVCVAENPAGKRMSKAAKVIVIKKPGLEKISPNLERKEGETAVFDCKFKGENSVTWLRANNVPMPPSRTTIQGSSLTITDVKLSDAGTYICRATDDLDRSIEYLVKLVVFAPPTLSETPEDKTVMEGDDVEFKCVGQGHPEPKVYWELPGVTNLFPSDKSHSRYRAYDDGRLVVKSVTMKDAGKYICNCHSSWDTIHATAKLTVTKRPLPPLITIGPHDQTLRVGATATFRCEVLSNNAYIKPLVEWFFGPNMRRINFNDRRFLKISRDTLQINDLKISDAGNYTCRAESHTLTTMWSARLSVLRKEEEMPINAIRPDSNDIPRTPGEPRVSDLTPQSLTLKWTYLGDTRGITFRIEMAEAGSAIGWKIVEDKWKGDVIQVNNLTPGNQYSFLVRAQNVNGLSRPSPPTRYVKTQYHPIFRDVSQFKEVPTSFPSITVRRPELSSLSDTQVKISWEVVAENNLLNAIKGYKISYRPVSVKNCYFRATQDPSSYHCSLKESNAATRINSYASRMHDQLKYANGVYDSVKRSREPRLISNINTEFTVVGSLRPFQCYEFRVNAYSDISKMGEVTTERSESSYVWTYEDSPAQGPKSLWANWLNNSSFEITWKELEVSKWNGLLRGYIIYIFGNNSHYRQVEINHSVTRTIINNVNSNISYTIHVAAINCKGVGVRSPAFVLTKITKEKYSVINQPWFIALMVLCTVFWIGLLCFTIYICCPCGKHRLTKKGHHIELVKKDCMEANSYTSRNQYGPDITKGTDTVLMTDLNNKGMLPRMTDLQLIHSSSNCQPTTNAVEPYASTSIINLGNLGPYASIHRGGPSLQNDGPHTLNNSYHHYYVESGMAPLMTKLPPEEDWRNNTNRNVMNIGEMIPPPPESPPPASPYYAVDSIQTGPSNLGGYIMSREQGFVSSRDGSTKNSSHGSDFSKAVSGVPRPCATDSASSQEYDQTGQPLLLSNRMMGGPPRIGNNSSGPSPSSNQSTHHSNQSSGMAHREPVASCSEEDDQELLEEDDPQDDDNSEMHPTRGDHEIFINSEDLESSQISGSEEDFFLEDGVSPASHLLDGSLGNAGPPSPGYSTDSTYSSIPPVPHKPYPKSERKRQMKQYSSTQNQPSGHRRAPNNNHLLPNRTQNLGCIDQPIA